MELLQQLNNKLNLNLKTIEETKQHLTELFLSEYVSCNDMQSAFDNLNDSIGDNVLANNFVYRFCSGGDWHVWVNENVPNIVQYFNAELELGCSTVEEVESSLESRILDTMCNVGCDAISALDMEVQGLPLVFGSMDGMI